MASLEKQAMVTNVFYDMGYFAHAEKTPKMVKAPFDLILIQAADDGVFDSYVQPCSIGASEDWFDSLAGERNHDRQGIGYISDTMVVTPSSCGDHSGQNDNWRGFFQIGMI